VVGAQAAARATPPARPAYLRNVRRAMRLVPSGAWVEAVCFRSDISPSLIKKTWLRHETPGSRRSRSPAARAILDDRPAARHGLGLSGPAFLTELSMDL
jgi:hypothetical protein